LYSSSNKQSSLYDETLAALEEAAAEDNAESSDENYDANDFESEDSTPPSQNNYYDDSIKTDARDEESESHSSLGSGFQYVSGGAGEGKQHLTPDGHMTNKDEVKSDEDLPAYCHPPNPCPVDYKGDDCDSRPYEEFTSEYSKRYQEQQNCMCDDDHNDCHKSVRSKLGDKYSPVVAKKSPRSKRSVRHGVKSLSNGKQQYRTRSRNNSRSKNNNAIKLNVVAKKSSKA